MARLSQFVGAILLSFSQKRESTPNYLDQKNSTLQNYILFFWLYLWAMKTFGLDISCPEGSSASNFFSWSSRKNLPLDKVRRACVVRVWHTVCECYILSYFVSLTLSYTQQRFEVILRNSLWEPWRYIHDAAPPPPPPFPPFQAMSVNIFLLFGVGGWLPLWHYIHKLCDETLSLVSSRLKLIECAKD